MQSLNPAAPPGGAQFAVVEKLGPTSVDEKKKKKNGRFPQNINQD